jgi:hypothetical protein
LTKRKLNKENERRLLELGFDIRDRGERIADDGRTIRPRGDKISISFPSRAALEALSEIEDARPYSNEIALDVIYQHLNWVAVDMDIRRSIAQPFQTGDVVEVKETLYTGQVKEGQPYNLVAMYPDMPSKVTGEDGCIHIEHRCVGLRTLRSIGIASVKDMLNFDLVAYWRRYLPTLFLHVDAERFGRIHSNVQHGIKRRRPRIIEHNGKTIFNQDRSRGSYMFRKMSVNEEQTSRSMQTFVHKVGRDPRFIEQIPVNIITDMITEE